MLPKQIEQLGQVTAQKIDDAAVSLRGEIDLKLGDIARKNEDTRAQLTKELDNLDSALAKRLDDVIEKQSIAHALEIQSLTEQLKAQEIFEGQLTQRLAEIKDGEKGEQGFQGDAGIDGLDQPLLEPVDITDKGYPKNTLGLHEGGLWISTKETVGSPESDPHAWSCILDSMTTMSIDLQEDHTFKLSVRMATGKLIESDLHIPYPEHKGIWEEGDYKQGEIVTKGSSFWQAMEDTSGEPPGNGWKQILSAPRGKQGPAGKSIEGPQGKPGRNGLDAKLPEGFIDDLIALASERKAFEDGRSGAEVITSFRGYFMPGEAYSVGDVVNFDDSLYLCVSGGSYKSIAQSAGAFELLIGVPKVAYVPFMHWQGAWEQRTYNPGMTVTDGMWTMVANKQTNDRAAPQQIGLPTYVYDGTITPTTEDAKQVISGMRYTPQDRARYVAGYRVYTTADLHYRIYLVRNPLGTPVLNLVSDFIASSTGWLELNVSGDLVGVGETVDILKYIDEVDGTPTSWSGDWDYDTPNNASSPDPGQIVHSNKATSELRVSKTDNSLSDRSNELEALTIGDRIQGAGQDWTIQSMIDGGSWINFGVSPATQGGPDGVQNFDFQTIAQTPIPYAEDAGYWSGTPNVSGLHIADAHYTEITPDDSQYGIDVRFQDYSISDDWDVVSSSEFDTTASSAFNAMETELVQSSATPFEYGSVDTTDNNWTEIGRKLIPAGYAAKGTFAVDAKRTDSVEHHVSEWTILTYNDNGITHYLAKDIELGADLSVRTRDDGDYLSIEVRGKNSQSWSWSLTAYYRDLP